MTRITLAETSIDPEALKSIENYHSSIVSEVISEIQKHKIVVIGMKQNPVVKKARGILADAKLDYHYMEYGSYFSHWKPRLAIKLWSGWPTYPQVFIEGKLIGGAADLAKFLAKK